MRRILGLDFGSVRIGIAVADRELGFATPYEVYTRRTPELDAQYFQTLVKDQRIEEIVVGLPLHNNGSESAKSQEARQFGVWLFSVTGVSVQFCDERYSTVIAEEMLREAGFKASQRKQRRDMAAAQAILTAYLESGRTTKHDSISDA